MPRLSLVSTMRTSLSMVNQSYEVSHLPCSSGPDHGLAFNHEKKERRLPSPESALKIFGSRSISLARGGGKAEWKSFADT